MSIQQLEKATKLSKTLHGFNDISFCNPMYLDNKCYQCKRFLMHLKNKYNLVNKLEIQEENIFHSYFSNPEIDCQQHKFQYYIKINKG